MLDWEGHREYGDHAVGTHDSSSDISPGEESREPVIRSEPLKQIIPRTRISYVDAVKKTSQASRTQ